MKLRDSMFLEASQFTMTLPSVLQYVFYFLGQWMMDGIWMKVMDGEGSERGEWWMVAGDGGMWRRLGSTIGDTFLKYELIFSVVKQFLFFCSYVLFWSHYSRWHMVYGSVIRMRDKTWIVWLEKRSSYFILSHCSRCHTVSKSVIHEGLSLPEWVV